MLVSLQNASKLQALKMDTDTGMLSDGVTMDCPNKPTIAALLNLWKKWFFFFVKNKRLQKVLSLILENYLRFFLWKWRSFFNMTTISVTIFDMQTNRIGEMASLDFFSDFFFCVSKNVRFLQNWISNVILLEIERLSFLKVM